MAPSINTMHLKKQTYRIIVATMIIYTTIGCINQQTAVDKLNSSFVINRKFYERLKNLVVDSTFSFAYVDLNENTLNLSVAVGDSVLIVKSTSTALAEQKYVEIYHLMHDLELSNLRIGKEIISMKPSDFFPSDHCALLIFVKAGEWKSQYNSNFKTIKVEANWYVQQTPCR
jgi:hypothetical protein